MFARFILVSVSLLAVGCRDSLEGTWEGDFECRVSIMDRKGL